MLETILERHSTQVKLKLVPKHWWTWNYQIFARSVFLGTLAFSVWGEAGQLCVEGLTYRIYRENLASGQFLLEANGRCVAIAVKPNPLFRMFVIKQGSRRYDLRALTVSGRRFVVQEYGQVVATVGPEHLFSRRAIAQFDDSIPVATRLFIVWLVILFWRRTSQVT